MTDKAIINHHSVATNRLIGLKTCVGLQDICYGIAQNGNRTYNIHDLLFELLLMREEEISVD